MWAVCTGWMGDIRRVHSPESIMINNTAPHPNPKVTIRNETVVATMMETSHPTPGVPPRFLILNPKP